MPNFYILVTVGSIESDVVILPRHFQIAFWVFFFFSSFWCRDIGELYSNTDDACRLCKIIGQLYLAKVCMIKHF